jgi:hypothetical protein
MWSNCSTSAIYSIDGRASFPAVNLSVRLEAGAVTETGGTELLDATHPDVLA